MSWARPAVMPELNPKRVFNASFSGKVEKLRKLVDDEDATDWGCLLDWKSAQGVTSLHAACQEGHTECASLLVNAGATVDSLDGEGATPLFSACQFGRVTCAELLLREGASAKHFDSVHGATALHIGAKSGSAECMKLIISANADLEATDDDGATPLHVAAFQGHAKCIRLLLDAGAATSAKYNGKRALTWARKVGHSDCVELLETAPGAAAEYDDPDLDGEDEGVHPPLYLTPY